MRAAKVIGLSILLLITAAFLIGCVWQIWEVMTPHLAKALIYGVLFANFAGLLLRGIIKTVDQRA